MKRRPRIELPDKREDELPLRSLIVMSVACGLAGLSFAYATADRGSAGSLEGTPAAAAPDPLPDHEPVAEPVVEPATQLDGDPPAGALATLDEALAAFDTRAEPADASIAAPALQAPDAAIVAQAQSSRPTADSPPTEDALPAPPPAENAPAATVEITTRADAEASRARNLRVEPGFVAYLRCEGLRQRKGRYPCPRDRALELRMREIVETLPSCRKAHAISRGMFDVRLELGPAGTVTDLHVRAPNDDADRAVRACAAPAFRKAETKLRPKRMIVSMRWRAR